MCRYTRFEHVHDIRLPTRVQCVAWRSTPQRGTAWSGPGRKCLSRAAVYRGVSVYRLCVAVVVCRKRTAACRGVPRYTVCKVLDALTHARAVSYAVRARECIFCLVSVPLHDTGDALSMPLRRRRIPSDPPRLVFGLCFRDNYP